MQYDGIQTHERSWPIHAQDQALIASMLGTVDFLVFLMAIFSGVSGCNSRVQVWTFNSKIVSNDQGAKREVVML